MAACLAGGQGGAGHSVGHYPSYYPDEIRIDVVDPAAAAKGLADETLHAYVGAAPRFAGRSPKHVKSATSLGSLLVLSPQCCLGTLRFRRDRCAAARGILAALADETAAGFVFHPYPVTPYHADYLHHLDRIEAAKSCGRQVVASARSVQVGAKGGLAEDIVQARWGRVADGADIVLEVVPVDDLLAAAGMQFRRLVGTAVGEGRLVPGPPIAGARPR